MSETSEIGPEELACVIQAALAQAAGNVRIGRIAATGRGAAFNLLLPNGQTFRLTLEEQFDL